MLEEYRAIVSGPGKYEGENPMVPFIEDHCIATYDAGSVQTGLAVSQYGRWLIYEDDLGFCYGYKYESRSIARIMIESWEETYTREYGETS